MIKKKISEIKNKEWLTDCMEQDSKNAIFMCPDLGVIIYYYHKRDQSKFAALTGIIDGDGKVKYVREKRISKDIATEIIKDHKILSQSGEFWIIDKSKKTKIILTILFEDKNGNT